MQVLVSLFVRSAAVSTLALLQSCTVVTVRNAEGQVVDRTTCLLAPQSDAPVIGIERTGVGLSLSRSDAVLGFIHEQRIQVEDPDRCNVIFIVQNTSERSELLRQLTQISLDPSRLCVIEKTSQ